MRISRILIGFSDYTDFALLNKAEYIWTCMKDNPAFVNPVPTLTELQVATSAYATALLAAAGLGKINVANKKAARQVLTLLLGQLGMYVMYVANGDEAILTGSGYTLAKTPEASSIGNPGNVTLSNGITTGEMISSVTADPGAKSHLHEITSELPTADTVWLSKPDTRSQFTFKGLVAGTRYWVRVGVIGSNGQIAWSTIASQHAQ